MKKNRNKSNTKTKRKNHTDITGVCGTLWNSVSKFFAKILKAVNYFCKKGSVRDSWCGSKYTSEDKMIKKKWRKKIWKILGLIIPFCYNVIIFNVDLMVSSTENEIQVKQHRYESASSMAAAWCQRWTVKRNSLFTQIKRDWWSGKMGS